MNTCCVISNISQLLPPFDIDDLELADCSNFDIVYYFSSILGRHCLQDCAMKMRFLQERTIKSAGTAFVQGDSAVQVAQS